MHSIRVLPPVLLLLLSGCHLLPFPVRTREEVPPPVHERVAERAELLWDTYGVPHIFAEDEGALFYAHGWAQMRSHADLVLRLYAQARGRAAEYGGEQFVDSDTWVRTNGIPGRAAEWLDEQPPHVRAYLDAFAEGMNEYAERHPDSLADTWRAVLPVDAADILAHQQRALNFTFIAGQGAARSAAAGMGAGSNGWAIAPSRSATRNALLLANPHLPWGDLFTWFESHLVAPGINAYGVALVGTPMPGIAFNENVGWTYTVNPLDGADLYRLELRDDGYLFDGVVRTFDVEDQVLRVRHEDGTVEERPLRIRRSVHGPVVAAEDDAALALRVAGLDASGLPEQMWDMLRAKDRSGFEAALMRLQMPLFNVLYADRHGEILYAFTGRVPVRPHGGWQYWQGVIPGDSSSTLWTREHEYHDLPHLANPETGWLQNANEPPWTATLPMALDPRYYPRYMAPPPAMSFRAQRSARLLAEDSRITLEEIVEYQHTTRAEAADHLIDDVVLAARRVGDADARAAADVLDAWDRRADADSRGAILFETFHRELQRERWPGGSPFEFRWTPDAPLSTPDGLSDPRLAVDVLARAAEIVRERHGALDVTWGSVYRLRRDTIDLPVSGGPHALGMLRTLTFGPPAADGTRTATGGDSWIAAIEFSTPVRAYALLTYGNASQPGSPHRTDQLGMFAGKEMREVWLTRDAVMSNLSLRETF